MMSDADELEEDGFTAEDDEQMRQPVAADKAWEPDEAFDWEYYKRLLKQFVGCGRCGAFLAGYRVLHGVRALETAAREAHEGWITLQWDRATRQLIDQSFGTRPELNMYYFDICCPDCQRRYLYRELAPSEPAPTFEVDLKLR